MRPLLPFALTAALAGVAPALAADPCTQAPGPVAGYLKAHPDWRMMQLTDLDEVNRADWLKAHPGACPGFAAARLEAGTGTSYAIALIRGAGAARRQQVVAVRPGVSHPEVLVAPFTPDVPTVVWRTPPGRAHDELRHVDVAVPSDSFIVQSLESSATQFYVRGGQFRQVALSD